jgi:hypothetical protein
LRQSRKIKTEQRLNFIQLRYFFSQITALCELLRARKNTEDDMSVILTRACQLGKKEVVTELVTDSRVNLKDSVQAILDDTTFGESFTKIQNSHFIFEKFLQRFDKKLFFYGIYRTKIKYHQNK